MSTPSHPDAGPGTDGHAPTSPATSPDTEPDTDAPPTQPSPDASEVEDGERPAAGEDAVEPPETVPDGDRMVPPDPDGEPAP